MSMEAHLVELKKRHGALEQQIADAAGAPSVNPLDLVALKRKKLFLKDQIARIAIEHVSH